MQGPRDDVLSRSRTVYSGDVSGAIRCDLLRRVVVKATLYFVFHIKVGTHPFSESHLN